MDVELTDVDKPFKLQARAIGIVNCMLAQIIIGQRWVKVHV